MYKIKLSKEQINLILENKNKLFININNNKIVKIIKIQEMNINNKILNFNINKDKEYLLYKKDENNNYNYINKINEKLEYCLDKRKNNNEDNQNKNKKLRKIKSNPLFNIDKSSLKEIEKLLKQSDEGIIIV